MKVMLIGGPEDGKFTTVDSLHRIWQVPEFTATRNLPNDSMGSYIHHTYQLEVIRATDPARDIYAYVHDSERRPLTRKVMEQVEQRERDAIGWDAGVANHSPNFGMLFGYPLLSVNTRLPESTERKEAFYEYRGMVFGFSDARGWVFIGHYSDFLDHPSSTGLATDAIIAAREKASALAFEHSGGKSGIWKGENAIAKAFQFLHRFLTNPEDLGPAMDRAEDDGLLHPNERPEVQDEPADA